MTILQSAPARVAMRAYQKGRLVRGRLGRAPEWQLAAGGLVDVQAHTRTHPRLPHLGDEEAREEIAGCKPEIEAEMGYEVTSFAYPAGLYTERDARLVAEAGYRAGLTTDPGVNAGGGPMTTLARTLVYWEDSLSDFRGKLAGLLDRPPRLREWLYGRLRAAG